MLNQMSMKQHKIKPAKKKKKDRKQQREMVIVKITNAMNIILVLQYCVVGK